MTMKANSVHSWKMTLRVEIMHFKKWTTSGYEGCWNTYNIIKSCTLRMHLGDTFLFFRWCKT
jgi:hypothetical protein